jgi:glutamate synthase (ferredoxin)
MLTEEPAQQRKLLIDPRAERAACGLGFIAQLSGHATHDILRDGLTTLTQLAHRGACAADGKTGDGAGVLTQIPYALFARELTRRSLTMPAIEDFGVGMFFLPCDDLPARARALRIVTDAIYAHGLTLLAWRDVPIELDALGEHAYHTRPYITQALIARGTTIGTGDAFERALYLTRKTIERHASEEHLERLYVSSLSSRKIVYKGLFVSPQLAPFYADLRDPDYTTAFTLFHQRYSTNTFPTWERAHPFRFLAHNGEINTLQGNVAWMRAREPYFESPLWGDAVAQLSPIIDANGSDSAMLDNALELLALSGRDVAHALMMLVPEAWEKISDMPAALKAFYHYHATLMEPWDGPAALAFGDGLHVGMALDRNGLRPARYTVMDDGLVLAASEVGGLALDPARIVHKGKLGPGQMVLADLSQHKLWRNDELKAHYAQQKPYQQWVEQTIQQPNPKSSSPLGDIIPNPKTNEQQPISQSPNLSISQSQTTHYPLPITQLQAAFGYTTEELIVILREMSEESAEPIGSMGDDTPHAVLSQFERPLYHYFKQRFAEVTNPPIDHLREQFVMSTRIFLGGRGNILVDEPMKVIARSAPQTTLRDEAISTSPEGDCFAVKWLAMTQSSKFLELASPMLTDAQLMTIRELRDAFPHETLPVIFDTLHPDGLEFALNRLCQHAERAVKHGAMILILSDREVGPLCAPIPMLLAVSAVHHHLLRVGLRWATSLVAAVGDAYDVHRIACLIGYGANAVNPYLALASVRALVAQGNVGNKALTPEQAEANFIRAAEKGLLKIMSKMGIATLDAYHGAQIFESVGIASDVIERYFTGTPAPLEGIDLCDIQRSVLAHHAHAFPQPCEGGKAEPSQGSSTTKLKHYGYFKFKKQGEYHAFNPQVVDALHAAVRMPHALNGNFRNAYEKYLEYARLVHERPATDLADHLELACASRPIPLAEVESAASIVQRFSTAAMSHGALSLEAHEAITLGANRVGALSNSGEGGEHPSRYGTERNSRIKQVASARFGVTPAYLMSADELQIKMAQGSKPGEGGQLPAHKVSVEIATIRHSQTGIALISPPPHHDIYSIEDLAQLIYDLKRINPQAKISVKLVAQAGVGTIAAGVAKAHADVIQISGHSGGTGASPLSSIKHVGVGWELGLAETQQTLVANDLRGRVRVRVDGGFKTGRHVIIGALLGADEFSFGTAAVVSVGCIMARACHLNTCPVGIATQRAELRAKFPNAPEWLMAYLLFVAEETRAYLAAMGAHTLDEVIGQVDYLKVSSLVG